MTTKLKPYPAYKDSGVAWLGNVPAHWAALPNRALFREIISKGHADEQMLSVTIRQGVITQEELLQDSSKKDSSNLDKSSYKLVQPGDLAYNKMRAWQGAVGVSSHRGIVSPAYIIMRPSQGQHSRYLHYLLRTPAFATEAERWSYGITSDQWSLRSEDFKQIYSLNPPLDEQSAIADFLDVMDARISRFIAAKRRMIALLEEKKQAVINQAVTRGLDPDVPLKDSGVDWLGEIPTHWEVGRLKHLTSHIVDCLHATPQYSTDGDYPAIRTADISPGIVRWDSARRVRKDEFHRWTTRLAPMEGDILYSREGERYGIAALVPQGVHLCISQRMMVFRCNPDTNSNFVMWQLNGSHVYAQASNDVTGATAPHVNVETIRNYVLCVPPLSEQIAISERVASESEQIESVAGRARREIELVQEYRTRLISDVVTGKLDVRGVELPAFEEMVDAGVEEMLDKHDADLDEEPEEVES